MRRLTRLAAAVAFATVVAACAPGGQFRTDATTEFRAAWTQDVPSGCDKSDAVHDAHTQACRVKPKAAACTSVNLTEANRLRAVASTFCARRPLSTAANVKTINDLVAAQLAVGRPQ